MDIRVQRLNSVYIKINTDPGIMRELWEHFTFTVPGSHFMRGKKGKKKNPRLQNWDGKIRLLDARNGHLYAGLYDKVVEFANASGYTIIPESTPYEDAPGEALTVNFDEFGQFLADLNLHTKGEKLVPHDYQLESIYDCLTNRQRLLISPTSSGKSLMIYCIVRWVQRLTDKRIVIVVPTTALVTQMYGDFADYSEYDDSWDVSANCHMVYSGRDKITSHQVTITTWQSLVKFPPKYLSDVDMIVGDEAHSFEAKSLRGIMEKVLNATYRIGTTGTLKDCSVHEMVLEGLFGPIRRATSTKELMDRGLVADLQINIIRLNYPKPYKAQLKKAEYNDEIAFINTLEWRNKYIRNLALTLDGNSIVMFRHVEHGKELYRLIKEKAHEKRKVFLVYGGTEVEQRDKIRGIVEKETNAIIVASLGTFSTGVNIRNIHNIIFASPTKSSIKVLQSIGRGLRKSDNGATTTLIDIVDDACTGKYNNHTFKHGAERLKMYIKEQFRYQMITIEVPYESRPDSGHPDHQTS